MAISTLLVAVVTAAAGVIVALINSRKERTAPAPPAASDHDEVMHVRERIAVLEQRADDSDERDETQDRRLDQLERNADLDNPHWRHDGRR